jgi:anti-anti-sigma factor
VQRQQKAGGAVELIEEVADEITIVAVSGRLDTQTAERLGMRLAELLQSGQPRVVIEASKLNYVSSAGFRTLLVANRLAAKHHGRLALCGLTMAIRRMFELGGLDGELETYPSREEAVALLSAG